MSAPLLTMVQVGRLGSLYRKYVGKGPIDIQRLRDCVRRETGAAEAGLIQVSPGLLTELRAERAEVGTYYNLSTEARA